MPISMGEMDSTSPMRYRLYFVKLPPPRVAAKMPSATAVLENTPMRVSADWLLRLRTKENSREKARLNRTAAPRGIDIPAMQPMAMPVKAEWPRASEKKLIRPVTIMVERIPNRGAISSRASRAFFMKSHRSISTGSRFKREYQTLIDCLLACGRSCGTPPRKGPPGVSPCTTRCGQ